MSVFGFSIVIGYPFPFSFLDWVVREIRPMPWLDCHEVETLHSTLVNCTPPIARSVGSEDEALFAKSVFSQKCATGLVQILKDIDPFDVRFRQLKVAGSSLVLQAREHEQLGVLKKALQGGQAVIPEAEAAIQLHSQAVLGVDKFSTSQGSLQPTVGITLGTLRDPPADLGAIAHAPNVRTLGLRIVFYRDRSLLAASLSEPLEFGRSRSAEYANLKKARRFFDELP